MRRFNGWAVKEVTGNQKKIGFFGNCFVSDEGKRLRQVSLWQPAVEPAAPKVNICNMKQSHGTRPSSVVGTKGSSPLACIAHPEKKSEVAGVQELQNANIGGRNRYWLRIDC
jgi:hypothetical protein